MNDDDHEHLVDTKLDSIALIRAVLNRDEQGKNAILNGTRCQGCLATSTAITALLLTPFDVEVTDDGDLVFSDEDTETITGVLGDFTRGLT